jgi:Mg-chelatase subunit ChlD
MTDPDYAAVAILVDRSGSMHAIKADAEGAINAFIADQVAQPGRCDVQITQFDDNYEVVSTMRPASETKPYVLDPRGTTALLDAIGRTVVTFGEALAAMPEEKRPGKVFVIVQTDGYENASREYSPGAVKEMVIRQTKDYGWQFIFLGASLDAVTVGQGMGFSAASSMHYSASAHGTQSVGETISRQVTNSRGTGKSVAFTDDEREDAASDR